MEYQHSELTGKIIAAAMEVHRLLGNGFQEAIYHNSLKIELANNNVPNASEVAMPVMYKGSQVGVRRVDILVDSIICVELKAVARLEDVHLAQALNYLEAFNLEVGLLLNFGSKSLEVKRLFNKKYKSVSDIKPESVQSD